MKRTMLGFTVTVSDVQRAVLSADGRFKSILGPGRHGIFDMKRRQEAVVHNVTRAEYPYDLYLAIRSADPAAAKEHFETVETKAGQVAIVSFDGTPVHAIGPYVSRAFWKSVSKFSVELIDTAATPRMDQRQFLAAQTARSTIPCAQATVESHETGMMFENGKFVEQLKPGFHAFWAVDRQIRINKLDMRPQALEITAQEILTKDRVSIRVTLTAFWRIVDPQAVIAESTNVSEAIYKITQFAVREAVAARTLDDILGARDRLDAELRASVIERTKNLGVAIEELGVKDVILPGEIRELINKVVEAERTAKANLIRRQEETAATRSLLNTAKLMEDNKLLLRLKELEALEKLVEKVGRIDLHAAGQGQGLEAILRGLFRFDGGEPVAK